MNVVNDPWGCQRENGERDTDPESEAQKPWWRPPARSGVALRECEKGSRHWACAGKSKAAPHLEVLATMQARAAKDPCSHGYGVDRESPVDLIFWPGSPDKNREATQYGG